MTPNIAVLRFHTPHGRVIPLWIPLFLLWIPAIIFSPIVLLVAIGLSIAGKMSPWRIFSVLWALVCALPGTHVRVVSNGTNISVRIL